VHNTVVVVVGGGGEGERKQERREEGKKGRREEEQKESVPHTSKSQTPVAPHGTTTSSVPLSVSNVILAVESLVGSTTSLHKQKGNRNDK
jgi:hypothetical protein